MSPMDRDLAKALDAYAAPALPANFAARVTERALAGRPLPPPFPRRAARSRWLPRRGVALGLAAGALMSATAAAAGVFGDIGVTIPALRQFAERIALVEPAEPINPPTRRTAAPLPPASAAAGTPPTAAPIGPALTPEQLETRFRAADARRAERRERVTQRVESAVERGIARREAAGLPVPSPEQRAAIRARVEDRLVTRDALTSERREANRDALRARVREQQAAPADAGAAPVPAPALTPETPTDPAATPEVEAGAESTKAGTAERPRLTPAQRETLRQRLTERRERLRRQRQQ
ncbi:MAG: hypothetical protein SFV20_10555 [Sphingopyxis sp.]|nr:hypothetical protein [Sphingopyxis sp.]